MARGPEALEQSLADPSSQQVQRLTCDDQVRGEDALRYVVETMRSMAKKTEPPTPNET